MIERDGCWLSRGLDTAPGDGAVGAFHARPHERRGLG